MTVNSIERSATVVGAQWEVGGQVVTTARTGDNVTARVMLKAQGGAVSGTLRIVIKKDIPVLPDQDYVQATASLSLADGENRAFTVKWSPNEATSTTMRGYIIDVWFNDTEIYGTPDG